MYTNAQSILGKLNELSAYAAGTKPDIILLTETWCNGTINDADLNIAGYQLEPELRKDRDDTLNGLGGGLLVYSKNGLKILPFNIQNDNCFHQHVCFQILTRREPLTVILAYRPPSTKIENTSRLYDLLRKIPKNTLLIGDINIPQVDWEEMRATGPRGQELLNVILEEELEQLVSFPTHDKGNKLDLVITNMANNIIAVSEDGKLGRSDHCIIVTEVKVPKLEKKSKKKSPNWSKADHVGLRNYLARRDWDNMMKNKSVEEAWRILKDELELATGKFVPFSTVKNQDEPKWLNREIIRAIRRKKRAWKIYKLYNTAESRDRYAELVKEVTKKIRSAKRGMEKKMANCRDNNSRRFANYIKSKTKSKSSIGPLKRANGDLITEEQEIAEELNTFFASVFTTEDKNVPDKQMETVKTIGEVIITERLVKEKIKSLKENSAAGPDGISPKLLKSAAEELVKPLTIIFRESMRTSEIPEDWRKAKVTPIYKKGPKGEPGNYRPVSLTSIPCRMLESIIKDKLMGYLANNNLLSESQHGFLKGRSCATNLITFMDKLTKVVDSGKPADVFYLDFAKAFDKVPHQRLLKKMASKGIDGGIFRWIKSWLKDRIQTVVVNGSESRPSDVKSGVPQGSVLGPPLFDIFIDDLDECAAELEIIIKFADDTKGLKEINSPEDREKLQGALDHLERWAEKWGMKFNIPKCKIMHVGPRNPGYTYTMSGQQLVEVEEEKDIGVTVHRSLKPAKHCKKVAGIAGGVLQQLVRNFHYRDRYVFKKLYIQYVRPHLEFASPAWNPWQKEDIEILEKVQRKAVGMISGLTGTTYEDKCKEIGLETLEQRREKQDLLQTFKILRTNDMRGEQTLLVKNNRQNGAATRSTTDPWSLLVPRTRLDIRKHSFTVRAPSLWNKLPANLRAYDDPKMFKRAMKSITIGMGGGPQENR